MATTSVCNDVFAALKTIAETETAALTYEGRKPKVFDSFAVEGNGYDYVVIGDITDWSHEYVTMKRGRKPRQESYLQHIKIVVTRPGGESSDARTAAIAIRDAIVDPIADDPGIGLNDTIPTLVIEYGDSWLNSTHDDTARGWRVTIELRLLVNARLS